MSYAEELLLEGERKGKIEGKVETIHGLVKAGIGWDKIKEATDIDENEFERLKKRLAELENADSAAVNDTQQDDDDQVMH